MRLTTALIFTALLLATIAGIIFFYNVRSERKGQAIPSSEFSIKNPCGSEVVYATKVRVTNESSATQARRAFENTAAARDVRQNYLATSWSLQDTRYAEEYRGKKYWGLAFSYREELSGETGNGLIHVSEDGDITNFLGCI